VLIRIDEFRNRVANDCDGLIADLQILTGRYGSEEAEAWKSSLNKLSQAFARSSFQPLHLYFEERGNLALEYQLPAASSWADVVLLGAHERKPSAVIIELKDWMTRSDRPGRYEGLIERQGAQDLHPSDQVRGYTEYCRRFHSAVSDHHACVHGCVLFTRDQWANAYSLPPNDQLARRYPLFTISPADIDERFPAFFQQRLTVPDQSFAEAFAAGRYKQERGFVAQIATQILKPSSEVFELLDNQRTAFNLCRAVIEQNFFNSASAAPPKKVIIIKGPPGSGKSVIAARLWASLVTDKRLPQGDVVFTTTSQSQNSNWSHLFDSATGIDAARGVIRKATAYTPITTQRLGALRRNYGDDFLSSETGWRDNLATLRAAGENCRDGSRDNQNLITIVDEAHALINPDNPGGAGQFGFATTLGPQGYHVIRTSLLTILLLDPLQGFRQRENTSIEELRIWSEELGAGAPEEISLEGLQFRCAGSAEYVNWIESVLNGAAPQVNRGLARRWRRMATTTVGPETIVPFPSAEQQASLRAAETPSAYRSTKKPGPSDKIAAMEFQIFADPESWEAALGEVVPRKSSVRLLATYCREWKTEGAADPHSLPGNLMDFHEKYEVAGRIRFWSRIWNFVPQNGTNYTWFVTGHPAGRIADDPLCEVGCPYAVRGFDYDYVGVIWLNDLLWRKDRWQINLDAVHESGISELVRTARKEHHENGPATREVLQRTVQAYRILFTRALKGLYVWIPDTETRTYVEASLG
jgi:DUF2075 family protein